MFFTEREKQIYLSPTNKLYDPVELNNKLLAASNGQLKNLLELWWGDDVNEGDRANAALQLARVARTAFGHKPFDQPDGVGDARVLEDLYAFLDWLQKKD